VVVVEAAAVVETAATGAPTPAKAAAGKTSEPPHFWRGAPSWSASLSFSPDPSEYATQLSQKQIITFMAEQVIETEGKITQVLAGTMFRVELANQHVVLAHISGKMRKRFIRLTNGDRVKLEMSPYDIGKARIVYRLN
jgi:translation initiation factor IF-1